MPPADGEQVVTGEKVEVKTGEEGKTASDVLKDQGPWYGALPEANDDDKAFKGWVDKKGFKDPVSALKGYRELEKHVGANRVLLPGEKDDFTQWEGHDKLGSPKEAKGYTIEKPTLPEGMAWDENFEGVIKDVAAKVRLHPSQLKPLVDAYTQVQVANFNKLKENEAKDTADLQTLFKEWGADKDVNVDFAKRGGKYFGLTTEEIADLEKGLLGGRTIMTALAKIGRKVREGATVDGDAASTFGAEAALAELDKLNERIGKGESLSKDELARRSKLYAEAGPLLAKRKVSA